VRWCTPGRSEQHDPQFGIEQVEEHLDLLDDGIVRARAEEERSPSRRAPRDSAGGLRVGEHAVDVDHGAEPASTGSLAQVQCSP
jgi:hypothetical protein